MSSMPTNYKTVTYDKFSGNSLNHGRWPVMYGGTGSNGAFSYNSSDVVVNNGLTINTTDTGNGWTTGGISQGWTGGEYGLYQVEAKVNPGQGTGPNIILWPDNNSWPPEIDLLEAPNGKGDAFMTLHWAGAGNSNQYTTIDTGVNVNGWHDYAVDWEANKLTFYVDNKSVWSTTQNIPHQTMGLGFAGFVAGSNDSWYGGGPNGSTPSTVATLQVAWASISKPTGKAQTNALAGGTAAITEQNTSGVAAFSTTGDPNATAAQALITAPGVNIMQGGAGNDTFFVDAASTNGWAEIDHWHSGDAVSFLGAVSGKSTIAWANATDHIGHWGATASVSLNGDGHVDSMVTFAGVDVSALQNAQTADWTAAGRPAIAVFG